MLEHVSRLIISLEKFDSFYTRKIDARTKPNSSNLNDENQIYQSNRIFCT